MTINLLNKKLTFFILFMCALSIQAQEVSMLKSEIFKDSKKNSSLKYSLEDDAGGLITIRAFYGGMQQKLKGYYIQHFDSNLKLITETEYEVENNEIRNAFIKNNQLHLIEYDINKKSDQISFNALSADLSDLKFSSKQIISFSEENQKKYFGAFVFSNFSQYDGNHAGEVVMSTSNNFFVINFDINNKDVETHKIFVFNSDFEKVYEQLVQKNIKDKYFNYESIDIDDNDGTVYFLGKSYENESRKEKDKGETNYHFQIYKVNANGQSSETFKNEDKFISSLELLKYNDGLICIGFYGKKDEDRINGISLFSLNSETLKVEKEKFITFSEQFLTDKYGDRDGKKSRKKEKGLRNIDFKSVHLMANGDVIVNAEEFYTTYHTMMSANGTMTSYTIFHFNDLMSFRIDKNGELIWARNINKKQTGLENSSFTSITVNDDSYFFINCSDRINKISDDRISFMQTKAKKSNLYVIKINKDGNFDFEKLIDDKDSKVYYKVNNGNVNLNNRTVILTGTRKEKKRILKLTI